MKSNLDWITSKYGFDVVEVSQEFEVDKMKQELFNIFRKYKLVDSLENLKNSLKEIKGEIENIEKRVLEEIGEESDVKELFGKYYYRLFFLKPLKSRIKKELVKINKQDKSKRHPNDGEKMFNSLKKFIEQQKFKFDAKEFEKEITKALGILIEDGLFAYSIWLESEDEEPHRAMRIFSLLLLKNKTIRLIEKANDLREGILNEISSDLQKTLLARQLLERMLIYARYRAKALQKSD